MSDEARKAADTILKAGTVDGFRLAIGTLREGAATAALTHNQVALLYAAQILETTADTIFAEDGEYKKCWKQSPVPLWGEEATKKFKPRRTN